MDYPYSDLQLAQRLERTEAQANIDFVEARVSLFPDSGAGWTEIAGAYAMFDGPASMLTQTFCLGLARAPTEADMDALEGFFEQHGAPVFHEVSPLADPETLPRLRARGYQPIEFTSILYRPVGNPPALLNERICVRLAEDPDVWAKTLASGWNQFEDAVLDLCKVSGRRKDALNFIAELDSVPIAAGGLFIHNRTALLAGASTIPSARRQGAQRALLAARMLYAKEHGCDLAMMGAQPGSESQRNAERQGFRIAYTRMKWQKV
jgi:GNAT superfamily N-acetyltransferase